MGATAIRTSPAFETWDAFQECMGAVMWQPAKLASEIASTLSKHRAENKCRLSLGESSVFPFFRGAKGDNKDRTMLSALETVLPLEQKNHGMLEHRQVRVVSAYMQKCFYIYNT